MQLNIKVEFPPINLNQNTSILSRRHCKTAELWSRRHLMYKFLPYQSFNSLAPGGFENIFQNVFFKLISWIDTLSNSCETALRSMPQNPSDDKSTLVQVMAWCRQAASHYLSQCCPRSLSPYGVTRPQWVNITYHRSEKGVPWTALFITQFLCLETIDNTHWWLSTRLCFLLRCYFQMTTVETLYNTINFCWSTHKRHSIARPKGRGMGCLLWVQRATYCVDLSILSSMKYFL